MIARRLRMNKPSKSNIRRLVTYLVDTQGNDHRVQDIKISGCVSECPEWASFEMTAVQNMNERAKGDKVYHLVLSFKEDLSKAKLNEIEDRACKMLGYEEHQRISVLHGDTDNLHLHICINKIHPERFTMHEPYYDQKKLGQFCAVIEQEYTLAQDNHQPRTNAKETAAKNMEMAGDLESLIGFVQRNCLKNLKSAKDWIELHKALSEHDLKIAPRANGFVISSGELHIKASSVDRSLSKKNLESRLGIFEPAQTKQTATKVAYDKKPMQHGVDTSNLWQEFQKERKEQDKERKRQIAVNRQAMTEEFATAKKEFDLQNAMIKHMVDGAVVKQVLYILNSNKLKKRNQEIKKKYKITPKKRLNWADWLHEKAKNGNALALVAMRARDKRQNRAMPNPNLTPEKITRKGTLLYADQKRDAGFGLTVRQENLAILQQEKLGVTTQETRIYSGR